MQIKPTYRGSVIYRRVRGMLYSALPLMAKLKPVEAEMLMWEMVLRSADGSRTVWWISPVTFNKYTLQPVKRKDCRYWMMRFKGKEVYIGTIRRRLRVEQLIQTEEKLLDRLGIR